MSFAYLLISNIYIFKIRAVMIRLSEMRCLYCLLVSSIRSGPLAVSGRPGPDQGPAHDDLRGVHDQPEQQHHAPQHGEGLAQHLGLALRGPCASYFLRIRPTLAIKMLV